MGVEQGRINSTFNRKHQGALNKRGYDGAATQLIWIWQLFKPHRLSCNWLEWSWSAQLIIL